MYASESRCRKKEKTDVFYLCRTTVRYAVMFFDDLFLGVDRKDIEKKSKKKQPQKDLVFSSYHQSSSRSWIKM